MPQIAGEIFNTLFQKAGILPDNPVLKTFLSSAELANIQVPDELVTALDSGLLSIEAAKNNHPDIKKKYFADAYDGMDKQLMALVANDTFDQADIDEIKAEKSTSKKAELIVTKLKAAKANAKGADKEEINRQLQAAHAAAKAAKDEVKSLKTTHASEIQGIKKAAILTSKFSGYKTIYDELDPSIKTTTIESIINKALQDKNAVLNVDENGNLILTGKDGSNVFGSNHVQLTPQSFLDQTLAPILKVSGPPKPAANNGNPPAFSQKIDEKAEATVSMISSHNAKVLEDMAKAPVSMI